MCHMRSHTSSRVSEKKHEAIIPSVIDKMIITVTIDVRFTRVLYVCICVRTAYGRRMYRRIEIIFVIYCIHKTIYFGIKISILAGRSHSSSIVLGNRRRLPCDDMRRNKHFITIFIRGSNRKNMYFFFFLMRHIR